jgi:hypothetical protein
VREIPDLLTGDQVSRLCYVTRKTVDNWRHAGKLEALPLPSGGGYRYPADQPALAPFVARLRRRRPAAVS